MTSKVLFLAVACLYIGNISCYDYEKTIQEITQQVGQQMEMYRSSVLMSFLSHQAQMVSSQFGMLAQTVSTSDNPYAIAHVINFRKNYTAVPYLLDHMINDTRDAILKTFDYQQQNIENVVPLVRTTSEDVHDILSQKYCNETIMEEFFNNLLQVTSMRVTMSISEGYSAYMSQLMNTYGPFMMFSSFTMQLQMCVHPMSSPMSPTSDTTACMVQKDDLYLSATINLVGESLKSTQGVVESFNLKITDYVVKDIENTFNRAYKDAMMTKC